MLIEVEHERLLARWRHQLKQLPSARNLDTPTLNDHIPQFLRELVIALRSGVRQEISEAVVEGSAPAHGTQRFEDGFDLVEVVAEYNILRGCLHDLADSHQVTLQGQPFRVLNQVLDAAIGLAVTTFVTQRDREIQARRDDYLAFVAHDLRTPLSAISMATDVLEHRLPESPVASSLAPMLKSLRRSVQYLEVLVDKVLEENVNLQSEAGVKLERRRLDLWPLVEGLMHELGQLAGSNKTQLINKVPHELVVYADASLLQRIFQNLLANAVKYTPGGAVTVAAHEDHDATIECLVTDNGAGVPEERLEKIFEKGETGPENGGGTGLGLAIVKTFVEAHGGNIDVTSQVGHGSTFRFTLPAHR